MLIGYANHNDYPVHRTDVSTSVNFGGQAYELPLRKGSFEHLPDALLIQIAIFLRLHSTRSQDTLRTYTRQLERFFVWTRFAEARSLDESVLMDYQAALVNPPADLLKNTVFAYYPVGASTADQYLAPIRSFLTFLSDKNLLAYNPAKFLPRLAIGNAQAFERSKCFDGQQWATLIKTLDCLEGDTPGQRNRNERLRFAILFSYALGLRVGELLNHTHANIKQVKDQWVIDIIGKGRRARRLSLDNIDSTALDSLIRYRRFLNLAPYPCGETLPLLPIKSPVTKKSKGPRRGLTINSKPISDSAWQASFKDFIRKDVMNYLFPGDMEKQKSEFDAQWSHLTPHSLRHTRITHLVERKFDLFFVQSFAGHERLDTTSQYFHAGHN